MVLMLAAPAVHPTATPSQIQAGLASVWTADTAASATLPDGKVLYVGGDATMYKGKPYGTSTMWFYPHQVGALESHPGSGVFTAVRGQTDPFGCNCQLVPNFSDAAYPNGDPFYQFWPGSLLVAGNTVYLYGQEIHALGGFMNIKIMSDYVARFNASTMAYEGVVKLGGTMGISDPVAWPGGHWMMQSDQVSCYIENCFEGRPVWIPTGAEADSSKWHVYGVTVPASLNAGGMMSMFRYGGKWFMITTKGDMFGGYHEIMELTANCARCHWHLTGKTWPATGDEVYSARAHPGEASSGELIDNSASTPYGDYFQDVAP